MVKKKIVFIFLSFFSVVNAATFFVDNQLSSDCNGSYSIVNRDCSASDGDAFANPHDAPDATSPGDTVYFRGGDYSDETSNCIGSGYCYLLEITTSGTSSHPITYSNYNGEEVNLIGFGYVDPTGPVDVGGTKVDREVVLLIQANYIHVNGFFVRNSAQTGIAIRGSHNVLLNSKSDNNWGSGLNLGARSLTDSEWNIVKNFEAYNNRHGNGILFGPDGTYQHYVNNNLFENVLSYNNGFEPDGTQVIPVTGDSAGGGNSDAIGASKNCDDIASNFNDYNICKGNIIRNSIGFHNSDDGMDVSIGDSLIEKNIMFSNGPEGNKGFKVLREVENLTYRDNIAYSNNGAGFEPRFNPTSSLHMYNNLAFDNNAQGFASLGSHGYNNLGFGNGGEDTGVGGCVDCSNNWGKDIDGNPQVTNPSVTIDTNFPIDYNITQKLEYIRSQFRNALTPASGSPLIDAGKFISGYHCPTAGEHPGSDCKEWYGSAPDIGVYEYNDGRSGSSQICGIGVLYLLSE